MEVDPHLTLANEFKHEVADLTAACAGESVADGIMRVRALADIAEALSTADLLSLAMDVSAGRWPRPK